MTKRVAVVGAGCSGLAAIKSCLEEDLWPTCFESSPDIGGLWNFTEEVLDKRGSVMSSTIINTSKEMMAFSDFPAPKEFPNFMPHSKVLEYFRLYAEKFRLLPCIRFNAEVVSIRKVEGICLHKPQACKQQSTDNGNGRLGSQKDTICARPHGSSENMDICPKCPSDNIDAKSKNAARGNTSSISQGLCRHQNTATHRDFDQLHVDHTATNGDFDQLHVDHIATNGDLDQLHVDHTARNGDLDQPHVDHTATNGDLDQPHVDHTATNGDLDQLHVDHIATNGDLDQLHVDHIATNGDLDQLHADHIATNGDLDQLYADHIATNGDLDQLHVDHIATNGDLDKLHVDHIATNGDLDQLRVDHTATNGDLDQLHPHDTESTEIAQKEAQNGIISYTSLPGVPIVVDLDKLNSGEPATAQSAQWEIRVRDKTTGSVTTHYFDFVLVCSGHHADISVPCFPGQTDFKGRIIHSRDLRRANEVAGSRHVVVGVGNSGCDTAVALSGADKKVYLSTRRGTWLMQRLQKHGLPADIVYMRRIVFAIALSLPDWILNKCAEFHLNKAVDHTLYGLRPKHSPFATHPTVNDELPNRIACGHVVIKPNIDSFTERGVRFEDGTSAEDIDTVVMATGYKIGFSYLDESIFEVKGNQCPLYLYMFPPTLTPPTLAVIGCVQAGGAVVPVSEMQCRLAVRVFKNSTQLPSQRRMLQDMAARKRAVETRYIQSQRHTIQVDFLPYMDELAAAVGCQPRIGRLLFRDPRLALACLFEPCTAYQYRLTGPHAWPGARDAILTQMDRVKFPLHARLVNEKSEAAPLYSSVLTANVVFVALCMLFVHCFI